VKRFLRRLLRFFVGVAKGMLALIVVGILYELYAAHRDKVNFQPPGVLVAVNGHQMHVYCLGPGAPTVVLESALGGPAILWGQVQPKIAESARVCSYDRDGIGWSEESGQPRTAERFAKDLHAALAAAGEAGPYVMVGHSLGGMLVVNFARLYPKDVAGMVLLDSTHPSQFAEGGDQWKDHQQALPFFRAGPSLAFLGWLRGALWATDKLKPLPLPETTRKEFIALASTYKGASAIKAEAVALFSVCKDSSTLPDLHDMPLIVLSASRTIEEGFPVALHEQMTKLSTRGIHRIVANASHSGIVLKPASADESIATILEVVSAVRASHPAQR
jgi:pimeloyl-ACP methyl ester carboxylesterase